MAREAQLQLLSQYENIELAEHVLDDVCRASGIDQEIRYWVGMALREALANAIKHGNKLNPERRVHVRIEFNGSNDLRMIVEDEGRGFDPTTLADPTEPENLMRASGRGVYYMRHFMDEVHFSASEHGGTRIELIKHLGSRRAS
ncbi:MAG: ATP-binding protein [Acidobacteriota bacterium]|jgi:serine/threonine-protein kinase RsbW